MIMFRSDTHAADGGHGGGSGVASRKAHPIFKGTKNSDGNTVEVGSGGGVWNIFNCNISLNDSDPRFRPPICLALIGSVIVVIFVIVISLEIFSRIFTACIVLISVGGFMILVSSIWLFFTRRKAMKELAAKAETLGDESCEQKNNFNSQQNHSFDPIMKRGLVKIYYKSCEDTLPYGSGRTPAGTKAVRVPPTDGFVSVESTCFQLIKSKNDAKITNKSQLNAKTIAGGLALPDKRSGKGRTLPARPTNENLNDESVALKDQKNRSAHISELDVRIQNSRTLQHQMSDPPRSQSHFEMESMKLEKQPMLHSHSNVYRTDFLSSKRLR